MPKTDFLNNGYTIPYPDDPFEMNSGPFYLGKGNNGETIVALEVSPVSYTHLRAHET